MEIKARMGRIFQNAGLAPDRGFAAVTSEKMLPDGEDNHEHPDDFQSGVSSACRTR
jgi:hypothetical protein